MPDPIKIALVGCGRRGRGIYGQVLPGLTDLFELVAVCDRVPEAADAMGESLGVRAFHSIRKLVDARPMEAVVFVTPIESHHAISVFLSRNGLHHVTETSMAVTLRQCREMVAAATEHNVVLHVNEQFPFLPLIAFTREIIAAGAIGEVGRITYYHGHTGYHNNSIWQLYGGGTPVAVNSITHAMPVRRHLDGAGRWHEDEPFKLRALHFASGLLAVDMAGNIKSAMGRCPRPGYIEIDGTEGTIVGQPFDSSCPAPWNGRAEVRLVAPEDLERGAYATSYPVERVTSVEHRVNVSEQLPHACEYESLRCRLPGGTVEMRNPMLDYGLLDGYQSSVGLRMLHFWRRVREGAAPAFGPEMAAASTEIESAFARSAEQGGARVELPFAEETDAERSELAALREKHGVDPMDVDAMIDVAFPKNYVPDGERPSWHR